MDHACQAANKRLQRTYPSSCKVNGFLRRNYWITKKADTVYAFGNLAQISQGLQGLPLRPRFNSGSGRMWAEFQSISIWLGGFLLRVLRFSSLLKIYSQPIPSGCGAVLRGHTWVVFRSRAPSRLHSSFGPTSLSCALSNSVSDCEKGRLAGQILVPNDVTGPSYIEGQMFCGYKSVVLAPCFSYNPMMRSVHFYIEVSRALFKKSQKRHGIVLKEFLAQTW